MRNDIGSPDADARLEARLEDWGRLTRAATGQQPLPELVAAPQRRPGSFGWQFAAGVLAVALAAAIAVGLPRMLGKDRPTADPLASASSTALAGPGLQVVTFHGLSITVPASWPVSGPACEVSTSLVELPGINLLCPSRPHPEFTVVTFYEDNFPNHGVTTSSRTTISGLPATRVEIEPAPGSADRAEVGYQVPELHASVLIQPAQRQSVQELADSLRVNAVDTHGCRSKTTDVADFPRTATSDRPGLAQALIPAQPVSASVCRYQAGWLEKGASLSGTALRAFAAKLNAVPVGLSRARDPGFVQCRVQGSLGSVSGEEYGDSEAYRIEIGYSAGSPVILVGRLGRCGDLGISNGARTGQRTQAMGIALADTVGNATGWPVPVKRAP
jgi:hypothetical protein